MTDTRFVRPAESYLWKADYKDGRHLVEFEEGSYNQFSDIERNEVVDFYLTGRGIDVGFATPTGEFFTAGLKIGFAINGFDIMRACAGKMDLITYKDAWSDITPGSDPISGISRYNVGYKATIDSPFGKMHTKFIYSLPENDAEEDLFSIHVCPELGLRGETKVYLGGVEIISTEIDLEPKTAGELFLHLPKDQAK